MTEGSASLVVEGTTSIHSRAKRLAVIHNPIAGRGRLRRYAAFLDALKARGLIVKELPTSCRGDAERWARQVSSAEGDMLVAAGGDGTINEVVNGLLANRQGGRELPLAILPLGTANVLAAEIGLSDDIESCVDCIVRGEVRPITLGQMNDRCFLIMAGVGLDAHVVAQVDVGLKRKLGKLAYVAKLLQQLFTYDFPAYSVTIGDKSFRASSVIVAKGRYYGGRLMMAPRASLFRTSCRWCSSSEAAHGMRLDMGQRCCLACCRGLRACSIWKRRRYGSRGPPATPCRQMATSSACCLLKSA